MGEGTRQRARVLVVDGEATEGQALSGGLCDAGYAAVACTTAADATRQAATFRPDLLMLETSLGGDLDGIGLARRLRADGHPLLIFVTHDASLDGRLAGFAAGADDYVMKPYMFDELLARVRAMLRRTGRAHSQVRQVGWSGATTPSRRTGSRFT